MLLLACPAILFLAWPKFLLPDVGLYAVDYLSRIAVIVAFLLLGGRALPAPPKPAWSWRVAGLVALACVALYVAMVGEQVAVFLWPVLEHPLLYWPRFPHIDDAGWRMVDLTVGLALVAVSEELAFRRVFHGLWPQAPWLGVAAFGLLHAPQGLVMVAATAVAGWLFLRLYTVTGRLIVPILAHYAIDLVLFSG